MDAILARDIPHDTYPYRVVPALRMRSAGVKSAANMIRVLSDARIGEDFAREWKRRRDILVRYLSTRDDGDLSRLAVML